MSDSYFLVGIEALRYTSSPLLCSGSGPVQLLHLLYESKLSNKCLLLARVEAKVRTSLPLSILVAQQKHETLDSLLNHSVNISCKTLSELVVA